MRYISGTKLDERIIRCDLDLGYKEGRQFGRGKSGGQVCIISCFLLHALNDPTLLRCETSIDKTMTQEEEGGVPRPRERKSKGGARRSKNAMQTCKRVPQWQSVVESGSTHSHLRRRLLNVVGHLTTMTMTTTVLDSALELTKIPDGCSFLLMSLYLCSLSLCHAVFSLMSMSCDQMICACCKCHSQQTSWALMIYLSAQVSGS
jgi:hypothetical protein